MGGGEDKHSPPSAPRSTTRVLWGSATRSVNGGRAASAEPWHACATASRDPLPLLGAHPRSAGGWQDPPRAPAEHTGCFVTCPGAGPTSETCSGPVGGQGGGRRASAPFPAPPRASRPGALPPPAGLCGTRLWRALPSFGFLGFRPWRPSPGSSCPSPECHPRGLLGHPQRSLTSLFSLDSRHPPRAKSLSPTPCHLRQSSKRKHPLPQF